MKTGIVMEIHSGRAVVMKTGGEFVTVQAGRDWKKGDVVPVKESRVSRPRFRSLAAAACLAVICSAAGLGVSSYYSEAAVISLDINPSIELETNRYDRVITVTAYNEAGEEILGSSDIRNLTIGDAIETLLEGELKGYLTESADLTFTVQCEDKAREEALMDQIRGTANRVVKRCGEMVLVEAYAVDEQTVEDAHCHQMTAGKYQTLMELREVMPQLDVEEYSRCGIGEIKQQIEKCYEEHGTGMKCEENAHRHGHGGHK